MTSENERVPAGLTVERVGFFTDAVFAIAMTLLVINIAQPDDRGQFGADDVGKVRAAENLLHFLADQGGSFYSYVLAFFMLWVVWRQHHTLFDRLDRLSPRLVGLHFPTLLLIGFIPYATSVNGHHFSNPTAGVLYTLTFGALLFCRSSLQSRARKDGLLRDDVDLDAYRLDLRVSWAVTWYWLATVLLCWWTPWVGIAWVATSPLASLLTRRLKAKPVKRGSTKD